MKRLFNIMMALTLSLMVVYLSVGTTIMHCLRSNKVMVGVVEDCCMKRSHGYACCYGQQGAQVKKHCMDLKLVQLSPTFSVHQVVFNAVPVFAGILPSSLMILPRPVISSIQKVGFWNRNVPHSPPRTYLRLLNSLII